MTWGEESVAFYYAIGSTIAQWSDVESGLAHIVARSLDSNASSAAIAGFYSIENFRSKLAFARRTFEISLPDNPNKNEWLSLSAEAERLSTSRNVLAHGRVIVWMENTIGRRYVIMPRFAIAAKNAPSPNKPPNGSMALKDIHQIRLRCVMLSNKLINLYHKLGDAEPPFPAELTDGLKLQSLPEIRRQMHFMLSYPATTGKAAVK
jgi:hypothetical protein